MSDETTTEQLAEIEGQGESTPATEYTPPEGWRWLHEGEVLRDGDELVVGSNDWQRYSTERVGSVVGADHRYIRPIESEQQAEPIQVREGRWRTRGGQEFRVSPMPTDHWDFAPEYPWWDGNVTTWRTDGRFSVHQNAMDLVEYLGPIEQQPQPVPVVQGGLVRDVTHLLQESGVLDSAKAERQIEELRSEVSYVQNLLGTERRRVTQLEELVGSLRTINEAQEKAFEAAGKENTALRNQLAAVKAELATKAETSRRLQMELDAAQQVPADSPELRQLRADLAEVGHDRDMYRHAHELLVQDIDATHQRTKAETVEAIAEWLEPIRREDPHLRAVILFHLPKIIRSLAGLNTPEDVD